MRAYNHRSMRRGMAIAAFALILAVPLWAQRGGGGHAGGFGGGGHAGGFGGGHFGGGGFAGHGFSGSPGGRSFSSPGFSRGFSQLPPTFGFNHPPTGGFTPPTSPLVRQPFAANGFARGGFGRGGFARNGFGRGGFGRGFEREQHRGGIGLQFRTYPYWGYGWGYPYYGDWGYYDPWWYWWDSEDNDNYDNSDYEDNLALAEQMNQDSLRQQQMLQQEQMDGDQDAYQNAYKQGYADAQTQDQGYNQYANVRPPLDPERMQQGERSHEQTADSIMRQTVLVFRDQHKEEIENYAIVGDTLWNFAPEQTVRIPLSELDIPATIKANQDRGITFAVPESGEGG